uniref:Ig-like domain-containing protein n=1 Tax=Laticauda laticaudata TaxID=8630 RepID=A0A8C5S6W7_LATLA
MEYEFIILTVLSLSSPTAIKTAPTVFPLSPCNQDTTTTSQVSIGCLVKGYFPEPATVQWNSGAITSGIHNFPPLLLGSNHYTHSSMLTIPVSQWKSKSFQCNVHHAATDTRINKIIERECSHCPFCGSGCPSGDANVYLLPPRPKAMYIDRNSKITCVVNNMQNEQGLKITWSRENNGPLNADVIETVEEPNGTYTALSHLNVIAQDWESGERFTCRVEHSSFVSPVTESIFKTRGNKKAPKVYVFPPHRDELIPGRTMSIVCLVNEFTPKELDIQWLQNHNPVSEDKYVTTPAMKNKHDDSFFAISKLSVSREDWNKDLFTCMVIHEDLPMKFTQRNISKTQGKK